MSTAPVFDAGLIRRYDRPGPRYTSYPTAPQFTAAFGPGEYRDAIARSNESGAPLSAYVHIPFCANPCYYCGCTRIITRQPQVACTYLARLIGEIERQGQLFDPQRRVEQLHLGGGTPTYFSTDQLEELMAALENNFSLCHDAHREFSIEMDPRTAHAGLMPALAALGFNRLSLGVQDFDPAVQRAVNREQSVEDTRDLIRVSRAAGFQSVSVDLIYGLPLQTVDSFVRTLDRVADLRPDRIAAYSYAHLPERFKAQRQIRLDQMPSADTKLALLEATIERLCGAGYVYIGMDHFALPGDELAMAQASGTLHRNFQGYSTRAGLDLVGLGLSAIGSVGDTYSQNYKTLNGYYSALDSFDLPVEKGLRLSAEDILRRAVIESLMCHGLVDIPRIEIEHGIVFAKHFAESLQQLEPMERDGLVETDSRRIRVTHKGRLLLRAIAMSFDAHIPAPSSLVHHSRVI